MVVPQEHAVRTPARGVPTVSVDDEGNVYHLDGEGRHHRVDGPAIESVNGDLEWLKHGQYHRVGAPVVVCADGHQEWWVGGKRHSTDGPAIVWADGTQFWFLDGEELTERQHARRTRL